MKRLATASNSSRGRFIFAYCNIRTNQVLYTLDRGLKDRDLRLQLPDAGPNTKPPTVRPDLWKPLWTLIYPENASGYQQGLAAFKKLREWKLVHEVYNEPSPLISRSWGEEERRVLQEKLENRGGSKHETVWDLVKRAKKKLRLKAIMDQKANSVADLAAVLEEQEREGLKLTKHRLDVERPKEVQEMVRLGDGADKLIPKLEAKMATLRVVVSTPVDQLQSTETISKGSARRKLIDIQRKIRAIHFSVDSVAKARAQYTANAGADVDKSIDPTPADLEPYLPSFPAPRIDPQELSKRSRLLKRIKSRMEPVYSLEGISIKWQNMLDSEFAAQWPDAVTHDYMGVVSHVAPDPAHPPMMDAIDWKERKRIANDFQRLRDANELAKEGKEKEADNVRQHIKAITQDEQGNIRILPPEERGLRQEEGEGEAEENLDVSLETTRPSAASVRTIREMDSQTRRLRNEATAEQERLHGHLRDIKESLLKRIPPVSPSAATMMLTTKRNKSIEQKHLESLPREDRTGQAHV